LGLLIEQSSTNLLTYSQDFSNAVWTKNVLSVTPNSTTAPDGATTGTLVTCTGSGNNFLGLTAAIVTTASIPYTRSIFLKAGTATIVGIGDGIAANELGYFNLSTGVATAQGGATVSMQNVGNGWYRCTTTFTTSSLAAQFRIYQGTVYPGTNGTGTFYVWQAQFEALSFATSAIPTTTAQVTRAADNVSMTGTNFSSWYNTTQGTLYIDANTVSTQANIGFLYINDGTNNNKISMGQGSPAATNLRAFITVAGSNLTDVSYNLATSTGNRKLGLSYKVNTVYFGDSGTIGASSLTTPSSIPTVNQLQTNTLNTQWIKKILYYPTALTSAQLNSLTGA
jgi:hypothetical protein